MAALLLPGVLAWEVALVLLLALMALLAFKYAIARLSLLKIFCLQIGPEMHKYVDHKR